MNQYSIDVACRIEVDSDGMHVHIPRDHPEVAAALKPLSLPDSVRSEDGEGVIVDLRAPGIGESRRVDQLIARVRIDIQYSQWALEMVEAARAELIEAGKEWHAQIQAADEDSGGEIAEEDWNRISGRFNRRQDDVAERLRTVLARRQ